ncbi:glycerophosphodiester phosphodiesterase [Halomonas sp. BM-2019]|uniref:glycerophosphodiester phosphodiesterase n=1 Tax=Halomonas sp. BM-2019 TaxID=2811227 RepID=UPI001B3C2CD5|nr:MAG: hypothetical protein J5F18_12595 [Halomonas sp. BM-2019]
MHIIAHRGRLGDGYENSISSLAMLGEDVDGVEVDVRLTADKVPVLLHDKELENGLEHVGMIHELTLEDVSRYSSRRQDAVPTLDRYLEACDKRKIPRIFLDIKVVDEPSVTIIAEQLKCKKYLDKITCLTKTEEVLQVLCSFLPDAKKGMLRTNKDNIDERLPLVERYGVDILFVQHGDAAYLKNRDIVSGIKQSGCSVGASILNKENSILLALQDGCDVVLTDHSDIYKNSVNHFLGLA